jgi:hypothetical protein
VNAASIPNPADIVNDVIDVRIAEPGIFGKAFGYFLVFKNEGDRDIDLKVLSTQKAQQSKRCTAPRAKGRNQYIGIQDDLFLHSDIIYDTEKDVKSQAGGISSRTG